MKKKLIALYPAGLLFVLFIQSCGTQLHLQASVEDGHQTYSGPSYGSQSSPDGSSLGFNLGLIFLGIPESPDQYRKQPQNTYVGQPGKLYAGTLRGPAGFDYSYWNENGTGAELPKTPASSDFPSHLTYMGGIEFIQKNSKDGDTKTTLNYLEVPLYAIYQTKISTGNIFGGLGPYLSYGIGGKTDGSKSFNSTSGFKPFDAGLGLTAGYKLPNSFYFSFAYNLGLANIYRSPIGDKATNHGFSLNVGYPIGKIINRK